MKTTNLLQRTRPQLVIRGGMLLSLTAVFLITAPLGRSQAPGNQPLTGDVRLDVPGGGSQPGRQPLSGDVDLNPPKRGITDRTPKENPNLLPITSVRNGLDEYLKQKGGKSQLNAIKDLYDLTDKEAREILEKLVNYYSSPEFQREVRAT